MGRVAWLCGVWGAIVLLGCGGGGRTTTSGQLRILQASPDAPTLSILIDGQAVAGPLAYTSSTQYLSVKSGSRRLQAVPRNSSMSIFNEMISVSSGGHQTFFLTGPASSVQTVLLSDGGTQTTTGDGNVRLINAARSMGPADVYIVAAGASIAARKPTVANLGFDQDTGYQLAAAGDYQVFMTAPGTTNAFLGTGPLAISQGQNQTVVALDGTSGGFVSVVLTDQ